MKKFRGIGLMIAGAAAVTLAGCFGRAMAQELPLDESGKVSFYEVVKADSVKSGQLYHNARRWLLSLGYRLEEADSLGGRLVAVNTFPVYDKGYVTRKIHGKVNYRLTLEVKDARYRYHFTDFVFAYYKEDRNYRMVPTGKTKPLEETQVSGWQRLWENHRKNTGAMIGNLVLQLKTAMPQVPRSGNTLARQTRTESW